MELYAQYIKEREGSDLLNKRWGFVAYRIDGELCHVNDIFILPEYRNAKAASELTNSVVEIAASAGCKWLIGYNDPGANGSTVSMKAMLAYGFELFGYNGNEIVLRKEIHHG